MSRARTGTDDREPRARTSLPPAQKPSALQDLQRHAGNRAVARMAQESTPLMRRGLESMATSATFGTGGERRTINSKTQQVALNKTLFSSVSDISANNGRHTLKGRLYQAADKTQGMFAGYTVLFLSGSGGSAEDYSQEEARYFAKEGADLVALNYRGFGGSESKNIFGKDKRLTSKDLSTSTMDSDALAMWNHVVGTMGRSPSKVIVLGYSLGGTAAARLADRLTKLGVKFGGLILHSALDSVHREAVRQEGGFKGTVGTALVGSNPSARAALKKLSGRTGGANVPIMMLSGSATDQDQLSLGTTGLDTYAQGLGLNVFSAEGPGGHMDRHRHLGSGAVGTAMSNFRAAF